MPKIWKNSLSVLLLVVLCTAVHSEPVKPRPNHPERYVVQRGDTLWDIAERFLINPWLWTEIWQINPGLNNPHLIYPGDEISLVYQDGQPVLRVGRGSKSPEPVQKLEPSVRSTPLQGEPIPALPIDAIAPFLGRLRVVSKQELEEALYIVSLGKEHLIGGAGFQAYVRGGAIDPTHGSYIVYRAGKAYRDPDNGGEILGYEVQPVADALLQRPGDPAIFLLARSIKEVLPGDRLQPLTEDKLDNHLFLPRAPTVALLGKIIAAVDGVTQIGQHQVVVVNLGTRDGAQSGHVLAAYQHGQTVRDHYAQGGRSQKVILPDKRSGVMLVFRPFERVSYALIMSAERALHVGDIVKNPS